MSRSGYRGYEMDWDMIRWRGAVASAIRGRRGQEFLRELRDALDALPEKALQEGVLVNEDGVCALGAVAQLRGADVGGIDPEDYDAIASTFGVAPALVREIEFQNDEAVYRTETPEQRFTRIRAWVERQIKQPTPTRHEPNAEVEA